MHRFLDEFILYEIQNKYSPRMPIFKLCPIALGLQDLICIGEIRHKANKSLTFGSFEKWNLSQNPG